MPTVLWWGRFDPEYSRNRILRKLLGELGWKIVDFHPKFSFLAGLEARLKKLSRPDLVWVPCFRQRDVTVASRWSKKRGVRLLFDPLISAYDKQVFEHRKFPPYSFRAKRLHAWEKNLFQCAQIVLADTLPHAEYFVKEFVLEAQRVKVVYVGAEEPLFHPAPMPDHSDGSPIEVLFYGSFIKLQAPQVIIEAAKKYSGPPVQWTLLGSGPLRAECEQMASGLPNVRFEDPVPYEELPKRIHQADILLGVFDTGAKAGRVIPNKVFQSLASGRPLVTRRSSAYPQTLKNASLGVFWIEAGSAEDLALTVGRLAANALRATEIGCQARHIYETHFSEEQRREQLKQALQGPQLPERA